MSTYRRDPWLALVALAEPWRRSLYRRIVASPATVGELARGLPISRPAVSQHLRALREAGLLDVRAEGAMRVYSARPDGLGALVEALVDLGRSA